MRLPDEGERIPLGDAGEVVLKVEGAETGGGLTIYEFSMPHHQRTAYGALHPTPAPPGE